MTCNRFSRVRIFLLAGLVLCGLPLSAQQVYDGNQTGVPPFGTFTGSSLDLVALQNGNLHIEIPIARGVQRGGREFVVRYIYDVPTYELYYMT